MTLQTHARTAMGCMSDIKIDPISPLNKRQRFRSAVTEVKSVILYLWQLYRRHSQRNPINGAGQLLSARKKTSQVLGCEEKIK